MGVARYAPTARTRAFGALLLFVAKDCRRVDAQDASRRERSDRNRRDNKRQRKQNHHFQIGAEIQKFRQYARNLSAYDFDCVP